MAELECVLCSRVETEDFVISRDGSGLFVALWNRYPKAPGHALLLPTRHIEKFVDLNTDEILGYGRAKRDLLLHIGQIGMSGLLTILDELETSAPDQNSVAYIHAARARWQQATPGEADFTHIVNDGTAAGRSIPHLHEHVIPRVFGDTPSPEGGAVNRLFGSDLPHWQ